MPTVKMLALICSIGLLAGCATVSISNDSDKVPAVIKFKMPDSTGYEVMKLGPSGSTSVVSWVGGVYSLVVIPDQTYLKQLNDLRDKIETTMLLNATTADPDDMFMLYDELHSLQSKIDGMTEGNAACAGHVGDYADVGAWVNWTAGSEVWSAGCGSADTASSSGSL